MSISENVRKGLERDSFMHNLALDAIKLKNQYGEDKVFDLTVENPLIEPPEEFTIELKKLLSIPRAGLHRYMENAGYTDTRAGIASRLSSETGLNFTLGEVIMTSGATGALNMAFKALLNPGEEVVIMAPYFMDYEAYIGNHSGVCKVVPPDANFLPDLNVLESAITSRTKVVVVNSPNNPTGKVYPAQALKQIADVITRKSARLKTRIYVVSDDTYNKFYYGEGPCPRMVNYYPHTIIIASYSKELVVPGERIGYTAVSPQCEDAKVVVGGLIHANRTLGFVNAPGLMQNVVRGLPQSVIDIAGYQRKRDVLYRNLTGMGYSAVLPEGAFYLFPRSPIQDDSAFVTELKDFGVLTVPGMLFGAPGYFRISYCLDERKLEGSFEGFKKAIQKYR